MNQTRRLVALSLLAGCTFSSPKTESQDPPDVLVVVLDTVRADKLSAYGYDKPTSPQLDEVAAAGVVFEDVTAPAPWTWPSHASLFTGKGPWAHGAHASIAERGVGLAGGHWGLMPMRTDLPTLAEQFSAAGYRTVSLASNRFLDPKMGLTRGFELADTMPDRALAKRAVAEIDGKDSRPLFMFVNILLAHAPWEVYPAPWSKKYHDQLASKETAPLWAQGYLMTTTPGIDFYETAPGTDRGGYRRLMSGDLTIPPEGMVMLEDLYTGGITAADYLLHQILNAWTKQHPQGIVVVTSDHGEYLGEHGLWDHGKTVYNQVVQVPLVLAAPGRIAPKQRVKTPVQLHDLYDTLLDLSGISEDTPMSLLPVISGAERSGPILARAYASRPWREGFGGRFAHNWSLYREANWALISSGGGDRQLFDVSIDPAMANDVASVHPERVTQMAARSDVAFPESASGDTELEMSTDMVEELKALGYLEE
jgi:arylsulfatase A-like enzyme